MILLLTPFFSPNIGGVETHLNDLCDYLNKNNRRVSVLTYVPITEAIKAKRRETYGNLEIRRFWWPGSNLFHKFERFPPIFNCVYLVPGLLVRSLFFMLKNNQQVEVIHSQGLASGLAGVVLKLIFQKRLVISTHAIYGLRKGTLFSKTSAAVLNMADKVLALSYTSKKELLEFGVKDNKVMVYTYWVNQRIFKPMNKKRCKKALGLENKFVVLFVGRMIELKGTDILLAIAKREPKINFVFVGTGPCEESVELASLENKNVKFVGKVENKDLPVFYNAADILAVPSKYEEGFGRVILEALSCGTPVVGSNKGSIPEAVSDKVGILVSPDERSFRKAIKCLFWDRKKLKELAEGCRSYAVAKFSQKNASLIMKSYYDSRE